MRTVASAGRLACDVRDVALCIRQRDQPLAVILMAEILALSGLIKTRYRPIVVCVLHCRAVAIASRSGMAMIIGAADGVAAGVMNHLINGSGFHT